MDLQILIEPAAPSVLPAPLWFVQFFKVLGFVLHAAPMNLWYAGIVLAMGLYAWGGAHGRRFSSRLMGQMPLIVAFGVNLGVVPLLFVQVAYGKVFYPATIYMAWFWLAIVALLIPAYYGVYLYAFGVREKGDRDNLCEAPSGPLRGKLSLSPFSRAAGWCAAALFLAIGFLFVNGFSLMTNPALFHLDSWAQTWGRHTAAGAALGTGLNLADPTFWPRWLMFFGLAVTTTAAWIALDAAWLAAGESEEYRRWAAGFAWKLYGAGAAWFALFGAWYSLGTWPEAVRSAMLSGPAVVLAALTAASPALPWVLLFLAGRQGAAIGRPQAALIASAQLGVLALNGVSRQVVQNIELSPFFQVGSQPESVQWGPMVMFLVAFVAGACVVAWLIAKVVGARGSGFPA